VTTASAPLPKRQASLLQPILLGGGIAGVLDLTSAFTSCLDKTGIPHSSPVTSRSLTLSMVRASSVLRSLGDS